MAKKEWAFASRTMGTKYFDTYEEASRFVNSLNQRALQYDGEAAIYKWENGDWRMKQELSFYEEIESRFGGGFYD